MGKDELKVIAAELVTQVRKSVIIDWTVRAVTDAKQRPGFQSARAKIKVMVKRILRKNGYPPDLEEEATKIDSQLPSCSPLGCPSMSPAPATSIVLAQAELLCADWVMQ